MCSFWDVLPTFEEIISPKAKQKEMDGVSMLPLLQNRKGQKEHEFLYFEFQEMNGRQAVRQGPWKLVHMNIRGDKPYYELYNLAADPSERHNILDKYPEKVAELKEIMIREHIETRTGIAEEVRPLENRGCPTLGHPFTSVIFIFLPTYDCFFLPQSVLPSHKYLPDIRYKKA